MEMTVHVKPQYFSYTNNSYCYTVGLPTTVAIYSRKYILHQLLVISITILQYAQKPAELT